MKHLEENAEIYVLGALPDEEAQAAELHLERCAPCAQRVAEAAEVLGRLAAGGEMLEPPDRLRSRILVSAHARAARTSWFGVAAAFVIGLALPTAYFSSRQSTAPPDQVALTTMVRSHFLHAEFQGMPQSSPAKVLYGRAGDWVFIIVHDPAVQMDVRAREADGRMITVGSIPAGSRNATLFHRFIRPVSDVELMNGSAMEGRAKLAVSVP